MKQLLLSRTAVGMVVAGAALIVSSSAFATAPSINSIADSWHNLGANNSKGATPNDSGAANKSSATGEVCVFCHTPHGGDDTAAVPIWNRNLGTQTYTRYSQSGPDGLGTSTFDAAEAPVGSVSIACLSCHDGTQALDAMLNAPGSGNNWPPGGGTGTTMTGGDIATDGSGSLADGIVQNLGTDLSNDHPISMQYAGGGITTTNIATTNDPDFTNSSGRTVSLPSGTGGYPVQLMQGTIGGDANRPVWWIERFGESLRDGERDRTDVIFYSRTLPGGTDVEPFVECGSCHDPHNVDNPTFLRVSNGFLNDNTQAASGLCLTCHDK
jgi:predicted CXXCH cytochrome family protein